MGDIVREIKKYNSELSLAEIEGLLYLLRESEILTNITLITKTGIPKETLRKFKKTISGYLEEAEGEEVRLNKEGVDLLKNIDLARHKWSLSENMNIFTLGLEDYLNEIRNIKCKYSPKPKREFDQFLATSTTSHLKAKIMEEKGAIKDMSVAFLGDDDLVSLSMASQNCEYKDISVFDIDDEILENIEKCSEEKGYKNIKTVKYDVREEMDHKYVGRFDVVVFDPPYTKSGVIIFLRRALELLKSSENQDGKYIFMYYGNSFKSPEKILKVQEIINRCGISIEDRIDKFARYSGAESIGNSSSLYILRTNKFSKVPVFPNQNIYTLDKTSEEKFPFVDHVVFKLQNVKKEFTLSKKGVLTALESLCREHHLKIVERNVTDFKGGGMTVSFILSQSNLTVHTWPEFNAVHIDLITCSPIFNKNNLSSTLSTLFSTSTIEEFFVE